MRLENLIRSPFRLAQYRSQQDDFLGDPFDYAQDRLGVLGGSTEFFSNLSAKSSHFFAKNLSQIKHWHGSPPQKAFTAEDAEDAVEVFNEGFLCVLCGEAFWVPAVVRVRLTGHD